MGVQITGCTQGCTICKQHRGRTTTLKLIEFRGWEVTVCFSCAAAPEGIREKRYRKQQRHLPNPLSLLKRFQS